MITFDDFKKLQMCIATVKEVDDHQNADKLYVLKVDLGGEVRQIVAGVKQYYQKQDLIGKQVVVLKNLQPATIRGVESQGMMLATKDDNTLSILAPEKQVQNGSKVS